jgi:hypothetical protein
VWEFDWHASQTRKMALVPKAGTLRHVRPLVFVRAAGGEAGREYPRPLALNQRSRVLRRRSRRWLLFPWGRVPARAHQIAISGANT